ncbi:MAG: K+/H+ antiporter [Candidatus Amoebophilus sp. 36-38]|nr:MAG: K+/H+ antiporter [Candidatus Amoebophilus sp. 36-38]
MNFTVEGILIVGSFLLFISILASKLSTNLGIPTLLIFLAIGMLAGVDGIGGIQFESPYIAKVLGTVTLTLILFSGGLDTNFEHIKPIIWNGILLSTVGVLITALGIGYFIYWVTDFTLIESMLVGAIVSSTDAAAVFSILRSKNLQLKANLSPTLELESGSNDAMAYFLMIFFTKLLTSNQDISVWSAVPRFFQEMCIGGLIGIIVGKGMVFVVNRIQLAYESLYPGITLAMILFAYSATNFIHGNGFLAVYIAGIILGSQKFIHKNSLIRFYDGIAWLMQVVMFISLGLLVYPHKLVPIAGIGLLISAALIFLARPISVFVALAFTKVTFNQKLFISWVGLRGAVPIVFATHPLLECVSKSDKIFHIVFFIVLTSVILQGTTLSPIAKWLGLEESSSQKNVRAIDLADELNTELFELIIPANSLVDGRKIVEIDFPKHALIVLINRDKGYLTPRGDTELRSGDKLMIMAEDKNLIKEVKDCLEIA